MSIEYSWQVAYRALKDGVFAEQLARHPDQARIQVRTEFPDLKEDEISETLNEAMIAFGIYNKLHMAGRGGENQQIREMSNEFRKGLVDVIRQIELGYSRVMLMYTIAFYVGIALIGLSVFASLWLKEDGAALIFGGLGMADVVTTFIFRPAQELQNSRGNLTQLQAAFFNWANDVRNWTAYLQRLDDAVRPGEKPPYEEFERVSKRVLANTAEMMRLVDLYCEIGSKSPAEKKQAQSVETTGG